MPKMPAPALSGPSGLSEHQIKKAALGFLKSFYKDYKRGRGETLVEFDMRGEGNIIIDGFLTFPKENGELYKVTLEATSLNKSQEVLCSTNWSRFRRDALALSTFSTAILFAFTYFRDVFTVNQLGVWKTAMLLFGVNVFLIVVYFLMFRMLPRYRYIYAIEQFKRYFADDQWVAFSEDVFSNPKGNSFLELRNQCVYNGYGLLEIFSNLDCKIHVTPSKINPATGRRRIIKFVTLNEFKGQMKRLRASKFYQFLKALFPFWSRERIRNSLLRYQPKYPHQLVVTVVSLAAIFLIFYNELKDLPIEYVDPELYEMDLLSREITKETRAFNQAVSVPEDGWEKMKNNYPDVIVGSEIDTSLQYDCSRLHTFTNPKFIIQDTFYTDYYYAGLRLARLRDRDISTNILWMGCFSDIEVDYVVYHGALFDSKKEARDSLPSFQEKIRRKDFKHSLAIRSLLPPTYLPQ